MREPTDDEVAAFEAWLCQRFGFEVIDKDDAEVMHLAAEFLKGTGIIPDPHDFLANYATTIGRFVFVPKAWKGWSRIQALCHEAMHVEQFATYGMAYLWLDATSGARRAAFEAEGYRMQFDCAWWRYGALDLEGWRWLENSYGLNADDKKLMDELLVRHHAGACSGQAGSVVSAEAIAYLDTHLPEIRQAA